MHISTNIYIGIANEVDSCIVLANDYAVYVASGKECKIFLTCESSQIFCNVLRAHRMRVACMLRALTSRRVETKKLAICLCVYLCVFV